MVQIKLNTHTYKSQYPLISLELFNYHIVLVLLIKFYICIFRTYANICSIHFYLTIKFLIIFIGVLVFLVLLDYLLVFLVLVHLETKQFLLYSSSCLVHGLLPFVFACITMSIYLSAHVCTLDYARPFLIQ